MHLMGGRSSTLMCCTGTDKLSTVTLWVEGATTILGQSLWTDVMIKSS